MSTSWPESGPEISRRDLVMHALTGPVAGLEDRSVLGVIEREGDRPIGKVLARAAMRLLVSVRVSSGSTARLISTLSSPRFSSPTAAFLIIPPALSRRNRANLASLSVSQETSTGFAAGAVSSPVRLDSICGGLRVSSGARDGGLGGGSVTPAPHPAASVPPPATPTPTSRSFQTDRSTRASRFSHDWYSVLLDT